MSTTEIVSMFIIPLTILMGVIYFGYKIIRERYIRKNKIPSRLELSLSFSVLTLLAFFLASVPLMSVAGIYAVIIIYTIGTPSLILVFLFSFFGYKTRIKSLFNSVFFEDETLEAAMKKNDTNSFLKFVILPLFIIGFVFISGPFLYIFGRALSPITNKYFPETPVYVMSVDDCSIILNEKKIKNLSPIGEAQILNAREEQKKCLITKISDKLKVNEPIDCNNIEAILQKDNTFYQSLSAYKSGFEFSNNEVLASCNAISVLQKSLLENDSKICDEVAVVYADGFDQQRVAEGRHDYEIAQMHATCIVHFKGTDVWKDSCIKYTDNSRADVLKIMYNKFAQCEIDSLTRKKGESNYDAQMRMSFPDYYFTTQISPTTTVNIEILNGDTLITKAKIYLSGEPIPWMNDLQAELDTSPDMMDMVVYNKKEEFSIQEVSKHSSKQSCWIVYGQVFDITKLLTLKDVFPSILELEPKCGTDVTEHIDSMPTVSGSLNTARFKYALNLFYIGSISTGSSKSATTRNTVLFTDKDNVYNFGYPMEWRLERHTNYIQLYNYPESKVDKAQFGKGENKIEGGSVVNVSDFPDFSSFSATTIADKEIYIKKGGIDGYWNWTQILIPIPGVNKVISFVIYGDMDNFNVMAETLLNDFTFIE